MSELKHQLMMNKEHSWVFAYIKSETDKVIGELKDKLRHYPMMVSLIESDNKEIRRLKRALWLARAERAREKALVFYFAMTESYNININGYSNEKRDPPAQRVVLHIRALP